MGVTQLWPALALHVTRGSSTQLQGKRLAMSGLQARGWVVEGGGGGGSNRRECQTRMSIVKLGWPCDNR